MSKTLKKDLLIILFFALVSIVVELVTFSFLGFGYGPKYLGFNIAFLVFFGMFILLFPNILKITFCVIILVLQAIIGGVNASLYYVNGDIFYLETIKQAKAGIHVATSDVFDVKCIITLAIIVIVAIIVFILIEKLIKVDKNDSINRKVLPLIMVMAFSCPAGLGIVDISKACLRTDVVDLTNWQGQTNTAISMDDIESSIDEIYNEKYLYNNLNLRLTALKTFGTFGFYIKNLGNILSQDSGVDTNKEIEDTINYLNNGELVKVSMNTSSGNNVISILLETGAWYMIDPYLTPNLYALSHTSTDEYIVDKDLKFIANNSVKLENYYSRNSSNVSEQYMLMGSFPYNNDAYYSLYSEKAKDMEFNFSLANTIKANSTSEVVAKYFHPSTVNIYFRDYTMESFGFDEVYLIEDMKYFDDYAPYDFYNFALDSEFMLAYGDSVVPEDGRFYSHISTITTHGSYLNKDERHSNRLQPYTDKLIAHWDKVMEYNSATMQNLNFPSKNSGDFYTEYVNYKSAMMDLDKAVGILFDELKNKNMLDNTTVVLYSDHYCYYNDFALQVYGYSHNDFTHSEIYRVPAFIFDTKLSRKITNNYVDMGNLYNYEFSSPSVLLPTVLDIIGIDYNSSHYLGCSVFDENIKYNAQIASLNGMFDQNFFSFNIFDIEDTTVADRVDYNNLRQRFYCNAIYTYTKMKYLDNFYTYNNQIFKQN